MGFWSHLFPLFQELSFYLACIWHFLGQLWHLDCGDVMVNFMCQLNWGPAKALFPGVCFWGKLTVTKMVLCSVGASSNAMGAWIAHKGIWRGNLFSLPELGHRSSLALGPGLTPSAPLPLGPPGVTGTAPAASLSLQLGRHPLFLKRTEDQGTYDSQKWTNNPDIWKTTTVSKMKDQDEPIKVWIWRRTKLT